jgi:CRP-like cAMP-binding protein
MAVTIPIVTQGETLHTFLKAVVPFQALNDRDICALSALLSRWEYQEGEVIFQAGEIGTAIFILEKGSCCLEIAGRTVKHLSPGDLFGEIAAIDALPRTATVKAKQTSRLLVLPARDLEDENRISQALYLKLLKELARQITSYVNRVKS